MDYVLGFFMLIKTVNFTWRDKFLLQSHLVIIL